MDPKQATFITSVVIAASILGLVIIYFFITVIRQYRKNLQLSRKAMTVEINTLEKERARIAADLHDDLGPQLSVVKFQVDHVISANQEELDQLKKAAKNLDNIIQKIRNISSDLMPVSLSLKGLVPSVNTFIAKIQTTTNIKIETHFRFVPELTEEQNINIYRIIQEIIHNAVKYSDASLIKFTMNASATNLQILIQDNGKGFDTANVQPLGSGIGLTSIKNRTALLSGKLRLQSEPGKGTAILITIPTKYEPAN